MKKKKAIVAWLCTMILAMNVCASAESSNDETAQFDEANIVVSFGATSDIHIQAQASDNDMKFASALQKFQELAGGSDKLDAVMVAGDLFDAAPNAEAPRFKSILDANLNANHTEVIPTIGNHDAYFQSAFNGKNKFKDEFGAFVYKSPVAENTSEEVIAGNYHTVINGVHFIAVTGIDGNHGAADLKWLDKHLLLASKANPDMPIFVETHVPPANTMIGSDEEGRWQSTTIGPVLEKYPQVVIFAGHTHASGIQSTSVWRGGYTAVCTGAIASSAHFVQVDKNGVVKITPYTTSTTLTGVTAAREPWVFDTMDPLPVIPTNEELQSIVVPKADILDVDFVDGTYQDKASSIAAVFAGSGKPEIAHNEALNKKAATFNGAQALGYAFTDAHYNKMINSTTLECMFYLGEAPSDGYVDILSNMNSAGQGFEYTSDHVLQYWLRIGGSYVTAECNVEPNQWVHAVATYDNNKVKLYINGTLVSRVKASGDITHPSDPSRVYYLGADVNNSGSFESPAKVMISCARVYSAALSEAEIYKLCAQESNTIIILPDDAVYSTVISKKYSIPQASATNAVTGNLDVTVTVKDVNGNSVYVRDNQFTPTKEGEYTIIYRAGGLLYTQTLKVTGTDESATTGSSQTGTSTTETSTTVTSTTVSSAITDSPKTTSKGSSPITGDSNSLAIRVIFGAAVMTVGALLLYKHKANVNIS